MLPIYPQPVSGQIYRFQHRVSYSLCTVGNHVYHSRFLDVLEIARGEFLRDLGHTFASWQEQDTIFPVIECQLSFKGPARYDDVLTVELWLTEAKGIRLTFACRILNAKGALLVEGTTHHVCTSLHDQPKRLPAELAAALAPFLNPPTPQ